MTEEELRAWLKRPEGEGLEFKRAEKEVPDNAYKTACAFANTNGGWLIFGVADEGLPHEITGIDPSKIDKVQNDFLSELNNGKKLNIRIETTSHHHEIDGKHVLAFRIPEAQRHEKPVYLGGHPKNSYFRRGASNVQMQEHQWKGFIRDADDVSWDSVAFEDADIATGIDADTLDWYMQEFYQHNPKEQRIDGHAEFLLRRNFAKLEKGTPKLTRAAVMLFGKSQYVLDLISRAVLDYRRIDSRHDAPPTDVRWDDRLIFEKNILTTWNEMDNVYEKLADRKFKLDPKTMRRIDNIPEFLAFRESVINLLMHQDYSDYRSIPTIKWFSNQMQFQNTGDSLVEIDDGLSKSRNPDIVRAFRSIGLSEQAGTGIRTIRQEWQKLGRPLPQIENDKGDKKFTVTLEKEPDTEQVPNKHPASTPQVPRKYPASTPQVPRKYPASALQVAQMLRESEKELTRSELQQALKMKDAEHFRLEYLQSALKSNLIEMTIPDKPTSKKQKYRLTELGRSVAEEMK